MPPALHSRAIKAAALVGSGLASFARTQRSDEATILTFHGLCEGAGDPGVLDWSLHLPVEVFRSVCALLAADYRVISLADLVEAVSRNQSPPANSVVITFDDGYASNYELAYPVLKEFDLHATVFVTTGFLDGEDVMWFQRLDLALGRTQRQFLDWQINGKTLRLFLGTRELRQQSLILLIPEFKRLPFVEVCAELTCLEHALEVASPSCADLPKPMRPLTWDMACDMSLSGHIDIGGHTHTHPILSRCDMMMARSEIATCRDRIFAEIGDYPTAFAYPNGKEVDYTRETLLLVREAGFKCACTTINGRVDENASPFQLPRYGTPESLWEAEATVSGAFETLQEWRQSCLRAMSLI